MVVIRDPVYILEYGTSSSDFNRVYALTRVFPVADMVLHVGFLRSQQ